MASNGILYAVDPYPAGRLGFSAQRRIARRTVSKISNGSLRWVRATGVDAARNHATFGIEHVDFIFIDGDHSFDGLRGDWEVWSPLVAPGGIVALHDSCSSKTRSIDEAGSVIYTNKVIRRDSRFRLIETVDTVTVLQRQNQ